MKKTLIAQVLVFALLISFVSVGVSQMAEKGWKKTVTLQSGEVVLDMSGEWDDHIEFYGSLSWVEPVDFITKLTQEETTFLGVKQTATKWTPAGTKTLKGELNTDGFKVVYAYIGDEFGSLDWAECIWEISKDGNKINLDCGERAKRTLTRR